jgi:hypothetical protein
VRETGGLTRTGQVQRGSLPADRGPLVQTCWMLLGDGEGCDDNWGCLGFLEQTEVDVKPALGRG